MSDVTSIPGEIIKASPPTAYVVGYEFLGMSPDGWVTTLTLLYLIIQLILIAPRVSKSIAKNCIAVLMLIKSRKEP